MTQPTIKIDAQRVDHPNGTVTFKSSPMKMMASSGAVAHVILSISPAYDPSTKTRFWAVLDLEPASPTDIAVFDAYPLEGDERENFLHELETTINDKLGEPPPTFHMQS